jgi:hypothetical protein
MNLTTVYIAFAFVVIILIQEFMHYKERQDLYNRIMARDLSEYKAADGAPPKGRNGIKKRMNDIISRKG